MRKSLPLALLALAIWSASLPAQIGSEGAILGAVTDASGAVVANAAVTATNLETGLKKSTVTNEAGYFEVLALPIGRYSVSVSLAGFKTWNLASVELTVGERKRLSPVLEVGEITERVSVEATATLLQTEQSSVGSVVQQKQIRDLPLNGRNPVQLVSLVPGMRFLGRGGPERGSTVQGVGMRDDQTEFQVDGLNANAGMDERGVAIPNVDTIAEFKVETSSFSAESGRDPLQVVMVTKAGTNELHGTVWEFMRNQVLDARNTFALTRPKYIRNQFGAAVGGPVVKDKTHFFGSYEGTRVRQERIYNSTVVSPEMLRGDFSRMARQVRDPLTGQPFAGNLVPENRIVPSARFFFPYVLLPNSPDGRFRAVAPNKDDTDEYTARIDHQITSNHRIYGRWIVFDNEQSVPDYKPDVVQTNATKQHNVGLNYTYTITPATLLTVGAGYIYSLNQFRSPVVGIENLTEKAGIRGFPSPGREGSTGLPTVGITGYTGFQAPWGNPGRLWMESRNGKAGLNLIRGRHTINLGYELNDRTTFGRHASFATRGNFTFNAQYTGDGFADYLLGLVAAAGRNYPLQTFGMKHSPYSGLYAQDFWKLTPQLTLNLGVRFDYWHAKRAVRGNVATFDPRIGKAVAGEDQNGNVDLTAQPVARFVAKATEGLWVPASQAKIPRGLFDPNGYVSPRLGIAWRPRAKEDWVIRAGYGIFPSSFIGNITASAIVGPPFWNYENPAFSPLSQQRWETAFADDPTVFLTPGVSAAAWDVDSQKAHEWNVSIQKMLPLRSALTVTYVGNRVFDVMSSNPQNEVPPGRYPSLQAARPFQGFGGITLYDNLGETWYNALQFKWERRFTDGLSFTSSYSFGKHLFKDVSSTVWGAITPFAPAGYNRGRSDFDRTHILTINAVYELPFGRGRKFLADAHPAANFLLGGWQVTGIYNFTSGSPLTLSVPGATLGNGWGTRPNVVGDPDLDQPSPALWFNPRAFAAPAALTFGNAGIGILDGPGSHALDLGLMKDFHFSETKFVQFRWELFNSPNHVNYSNPVTTFGIASTGQIFSAGMARQMQFGLKFIF